MIANIFITRIIMKKKINNLLDNPIKEIKQKKLYTHKVHISLIFPLLWKLMD